MPEYNFDFTPDVFGDTYLIIELMIPRDGNSPYFAKVTKHLRDKDRLPIGRSDNNTILVTIMYEV